MLEQNRGIVLSLCIARIVTGKRLNIVMTMTPLETLKLN